MIGIFNVSGPVAIAFDSPPLDIVDRKNELKMEVASYIIEDILLSLLRGVTREEACKLLGCRKLEAAAELADAIVKAYSIVYYHLRVSRKCRVCSCLIVNPCGASAT